jgi:hypothetical protein
MGEMLSGLQEPARLLLYKSRTSRSARRDFYSSSQAGSADAQVEHVALLSLR